MFGHIGLLRHSVGQSSHAGHVEVDYVLDVGTCEGRGMTGEARDWRHNPPWNQQEPGRRLRLSGGGGGGGG